MSRVSLDEAKSYCNVYFSEKDTEIQLMIDAAERHVLNWLNRDDWTDLLEQVDSPVDSPAAERLFPDVKLGVLMYVDDFWQNRGIGIVGTTIAENPRASAVLHLYRKGLGV